MATSTVNHVNSSSNIALIAPLKSSVRKKIWFWGPECRYEVIFNNIKKLNNPEDSKGGWKIVDDEKYESKANIYWVDVATIHERFRTIQPWQVINHFPGMPNIARKNRMGQNLNKMLKLFPVRYVSKCRIYIIIC